MNRFGPILLALLLAVLGNGCKPSSSSRSSAPTPPNPSSSNPGIDYEQVIVLDAEALAEQGIAEAYERLAGKLAELGVELEKIEALVNDTTGSYAVLHRGKLHKICGPGLAQSQGQSWGRATVAFFQIVNAQLADSPHTFYALYGGNELGGVFLTEEDYRAALTDLPDPQQRPYLPKLEHPWYGQLH